MKRLTRRLRRRPSDDEGSALILALLMVMVIGIIMGAVISFADTGLLVAPKLRDTRNQTNYAQGALDGAINSIRGSSVSGTAGTGFPCPPFTASTPYTPDGDGPNQGVNDSASNHTFRATCEGRTTGNDPDDQPLFAIHTLGGAPDGLRQANDGGNHQLSVNGGIFSNGNIIVDAGTGNTHNNMYVTGSVFARGTCSPTALITSTDRSGPNNGLYCPGYADPNNRGADPKYPLGLTNQAQLTSLVGADSDLDSGADPIPTCGTRSDVLEFTPGYYSVTPQTLASLASSSCDRTIYWFKPGKYFFDYNANWDLGTPSSVKVVGGTPTTWIAGSVGTSPPLGRACQKDQPGVQFQFGGASTVTVTSSGGIEVCGPSPTESANRTFNTLQRVALSTMPVGGGTDPNTAATPTPVPATSFVASSAPTAALIGAPWAPPLSDAQTLGDGRSSRATLSSASNNPPALTATATLNYGVGNNRGFQPIPKGSRITSVAVRVKQRGSNLSTARLTVSTPYTRAAGGSSPSYPAYQTNGGNSCESTSGCTLDVDVPLTDISLSTSNAPRVQWRDIENLNLSYTATVRNPAGRETIVNGWAEVDGIELRVAYVPPALEALASPLAAAGGTNPFFSSTVNLNTFFHGTVYTPNAFLDVKVNNRTGTIFDRGVVTRSLKVHVAASSKQTDPPFSLPNGFRGGRKVLFNACMDGDLRARAFVEYVDRFTPPGASEPLAYPGYRVKVVKWNVLDPGTPCP